MVVEEFSYVVGFEGQTMCVDTAACVAVVAVGVAVVAVAAEAVGVAAVAVVVVVVGGVAD